MQYTIPFASSQLTNAADFTVSSASILKFILYDSHTVILESHYVCKNNKLEFVVPSSLELGLVWLKLSWRSFRLVLKYHCSFIEVSFKLVWVRSCRHTNSGAAWQPSRNYLAKITQFCRKLRLFGKI